MFYSELLKFDQTLKGDETPSCSSIFIHPELSVILPYDESGSCETKLMLICMFIHNKHNIHNIHNIHPSRTQGFTSTYMMKVEVVKENPS